MLRRIFFYLIVTCSTIWVGWNFFTVNNTAQLKDPSYFIGNSDTILTRINLTDSDLLSFSQLQESIPPLQALMISSENIQSLFYTNDSSKMLILGKKNWTSSLIKSHFRTGNIELKFGGKSFHSTHFNGQIEKTALIIYTSEKPNILNKKRKLNLDLKADFNQVFIENNTLTRKIDTYLNPYKTYTTKYELNQFSENTDDFKLFAHIIPANIQRYQFYQKTYLESIDSTFKNNLMSTWAQNGVAIIRYKGENIILSDFIPEIDPILLLNEANQSFDQRQFSLPLLHVFDQKSTYIVDYINEHVIIAPSQQILDSYKTEIKLGNALTNTSNSITTSFQELPTTCSSREISKDVSNCSSRFKNLTISCSILDNQDRLVSKKEELSILNPGISVQTFVLSDDKRILAVQGNDSVLKIYRDNEVSGTVHYPEKITDLKLVDIYQAGKNQIITQGIHSISIYETNGHKRTSFSIGTEAKITSEIKLYTWKGQSFFILTDDKKSVHIYDTQGRNISSFNLNFENVRPIDVWSSQGKLFYGFHSDTEFLMVNAKTKKEHRRFPINSSFRTSISKNELIHIGVFGNELFRIDQLGNKEILNGQGNYRLFNTSSHPRFQIIPVQKDDQLLFYQADGNPIGQIKLQFNELEGVNISKQANQKKSVSFFDAIENKVYLYTIDGELITDHQLKGERKATHYWLNNTLKVITIIDNSIITYNF